MTGKASPSFTSWKWDLLNAAGMDRALKPVSVRLLLRLMEALDGRTWDPEASTCIARIGDDVIADETPGLKDRQTIRDHRKALASAGWLSFDPGSGRRATVYVLTDKPANAILDRRIELREARKMRREIEQLERRAAPRKGGERPLVPDVRGGQTSPPEGDLHPPVHLRGSPSDSPPTVQDMALGVQMPEIDQRCEECGRPGTVNVGGEWRCDRHRFSLLIDPESDAYLLASRGD